MRHRTARRSRSLRRQCSMATRRAMRKRALQRQRSWSCPWGIGPTCGPQSACRHSARCSMRLALPREHGSSLCTSPDHTSACPHFNKYYPCLWSSVVCGWPCTPGCTKFLLCCTVGCLHCAMCFLGGSGTYGCPACPWRQAHLLFCRVLPLAACVSEYCKSIQLLCHLLGS